MATRWIPTLIPYSRQWVYYEQRQCLVGQIKPHTPSFPQTKRYALGILTKNKALKVEQKVTKLVRKKMYTTKVYWALNYKIYLRLP